MATNYPYVSSQGAVVKAFEQFRKSFPPALSAEVLQKFSIAPANESYVITLFKFLELIDPDGNKVDSNTDFFFGGDPQFQQGLEKRILTTYKALFDDHGPSAWDESRETLTTWFRVTDKSSDLVGGRQASTFMTLAGLAGHGEAPKATPNASGSTPGAAKKTPAKKAPAKKAPTGGSIAQTTHLPPNPAAVDQPNGDSSVGLTVRIEVNLPAGATASEYDSMFASIRKHLIDRA